MSFAYLRTGALLIASALLITAPSQPASGATAVDVTYDLSDSSLDIGTVSQLNRNFSGTMTVRYSNDGGLGIVSGPATILSFTFDAYLGFLYGAGATIDLTGQLVNTVTGTLIGGSALSGLNGWSLAMQGTLHCKLTGTCTGLGVPASTPTLVSGTATGTAQLAGLIGPYGGAQGTVHTLSGSVPATITVLPGVITAQAVNVVGREVSRTPVPEPGTLLLLGVGAAGLALVGRATRRPRQR